MLSPPPEAATGGETGATAVVLLHCCAAATADAVHTATGGSNPWSGNGQGLSSAQLYLHRAKRAPATGGGRRPGLVRWRVVHARVAVRAGPGADGHALHTHTGLLKSPPALHSALHPSYKRAHTHTRHARHTRIHKRVCECRLTRMRVHSSPQLLPPLPCFLQPLDSSRWLPPCADASRVVCRLCSAGLQAEIIGAARAGDELEAWAAATTALATGGGGGSGGGASGGGGGAGGEWVELAASSAPAGAAGGTGAWMLVDGAALGLGRLLERL